MILLLLFAFIAGVVTILSPCILPILPIVLSSSVGEHQTSKRRPFGIVVGFVASFTFFTLFLSTIVKLTGIPGDTLRIISVIIIGSFGISLLIPEVQTILERLFSKLAQFAPQSQHKRGFLGGVIIGLSLGLLWTPCVGPILASVIALAITGNVTGEAFFITLSYAIGTAIPMFLIMYGGAQLLRKVPWLLKNTETIQRVFGVLMVLTALALLLNLDRKFQTFILTTFPSYGTGLTKIEDVPFIRDQLQKLQPGKKSSPASSLPFMQSPTAPELIPGGQWFNLPAGKQNLTLKDLKGKVVLIDFWTYSCINCQRTLPYLRSWWDKYKDDGLVIIGVHSPEFAFEKESKNVAQAIKDFNLHYPIMQDNDFATWRAYDNHYWPAKYLIDKNGVIRYTHFGEGQYDETEEKIQELLKETGVSELPTEIHNPTYSVDARTPETYLGYERMERFASPEFIKEDEQATYTAPKDLPDNSFAYTGKWLVSKEYAAPQKDSKLLFNFDAKNVYLVMRTNGKSAKVKVLLDGKAQAFGADNKDGIVSVDKDRLYHLISLPSASNHILELQFEDNNVEVFAFTFG